MNDCASPCIMGITVGHTTFEEALTILQKMKSTRQDISALSIQKDRISFSLIPPAGSEAEPTPLTVAFEDGIARSVGVGVWTYLVNMPTLADLALAYGTPQCAIEDRAAGNHLENIYIVDPKRGLVVYIFGSYLIDWDSPVYSFSVSIQSPTQMQNPCACFTWHGPKVTYGMAGGQCSDDL